MVKWVMVLLYWLKCEKTAGIRERFINPVYVAFCMSMECKMKNRKIEKLDIIKMNSSIIV